MEGLSGEARDTVTRGITLDRIIALRSSSGKDQAAPRQRRQAVVVPALSLSLSAKQSGLASPARISMMTSSNGSPRQLAMSMPSPSQSQSPRGFVTLRSQSSMSTERDLQALAQAIVVNRTEMAWNILTESFKNFQVSVLDHQVDITLINLDRVSGGFFLTYADNNTPVPDITYVYNFLMYCRVVYHEDATYYCNLSVPNIRDDNVLGDEMEIEVKWKHGAPPGFTGHQISAALSSHKCRNQIRQHVMKFERLYRREFLGIFDPLDPEYIEDQQRKLQEQLAAMKRQELKSIPKCIRRKMRFGMKVDGELGGSRRGSLGSQRSREEVNWEEDSEDDEPGAAAAGAGAVAEHRSIFPALTQHALSRAQMDQSVASLDLLVKTRRHRYGKSLIKPPPGPSPPS